MASGGAPRPFSRPDVISSPTDYGYFGGQFGVKAIDVNRQRSRDGRLNTERASNGKQVDDGRFDEERERERERVSPRGCIMH